MIHTAWMFKPGLVFWASLCLHILFTEMLVSLTSLSLRKDYIQNSPKMSSLHRILLDLYCVCSLSQGTLKLNCMQKCKGTNWWCLLKLTYSTSHYLQCWTYLSWAGGGGMCSFWNYIVWKLYIVSGSAKSSKDSETSWSRSETQN